MSIFRSLQLAALVGLSAASLSSCSSARYFDFSGGSSQAGGYHRSTVAVQPATPAPASATEAVTVLEPLAEPTALTASAAPEVTPTPAPTAAQAAPAPAKLSEQLTTARAERTLTRAQERRYEQVLKRVKTEESRREASGLKADVNIVELILAIFLPPIGVLLHEGGKLTTRFWISLLLTLLFFFPGMIYSILVVTNTI